MCSNALIPFKLFERNKIVVPRQTFDFFHCLTNKTSVWFPIPLIAIVLTWIQNHNVNTTLLLHLVYIGPINLIYVIQLTFLINAIFGPRYRSYLRMNVVSLFCMDESDHILGSFVSHTAGYDDRLISVIFTNNIKTPQIWKDWYPKKNSE